MSGPVTAGAEGPAPWENTKSVDPPLLSDAGERRRKRWQRRDAHQRFLDHQAALAGSWDAVPGARLGKCGRTLLGDAVEIRALLGDAPTAYFAGVVRCGRVWSCPVCSAVIRARRSAEVELAALRWVNDGGALVMVTTTLPHRVTDRLADTRSALSEAWRLLQQRKGWRRLRAEGVEHIVHGLEVTWGANGFHPHRHSLLLVRPDVDVDQVVAELADWLPGSWASAVVAKLGRRPSDRYGVRVQALGADAAAYVAKIADEHTRADLKSDARNPFALLDGMEDGEARHIAMWCEYVEAMKGARAIVMTPGLRDALLPDVEDLSDEEVAEQDVGGGLCEVVPGDVFRRWRRLRARYGVNEALRRLEDWERRLLLDPTTIGA